MSNQLYEVHCSIVYPESLTTLDRQLLGHYCYRFNPILTPPRAYPGMEELQRLTGMGQRSILRSRARLIKLGYLTKLQKGRPGVTSEFRVNVALLESLIRVPEESPEIWAVTTQSSQMPSETRLDDPGDIANSPLGHPKSIESIKSKKSKEFNLVRFNHLIEGLPKSLQNTITPGAGLEECLNKLERQGTTPKAIYSLLNNHNWNGATHAYPILLRLLGQFSTEIEASAELRKSEQERTQREIKIKKEHDQHLATSDQIAKHMAVIRESLASRKTS